MKAFLARWSTPLVFVTALVLYLISTHLMHAYYDNFIRLAYALTHGRLWIDWPGPAIEALEFNGQHYVIEGPIPAVLCIPLVLLFGLDANQAIVCAIAAAIGVSATWVMLGRMRVTRDVQIWTTVFLGFGTVYWWCASFGSLWMFAHITGAMFALLALAEWYGRRRPWLLGVLFACLALSRFPMALAGIPFAVWLVIETPKGQRLRALAQTALGALPFFLLFIAYNYGRWHTLNDIGYTTWFHQDEVGSATGSPFQLKFLPGNLYSFFFLPPDFTVYPPWLKPTGAGVALTFTSPALLLAFFAPARARETWFLWIATILTAIPSALYYVNGFEQFGMRHSMDFAPFLIPLVARGLERARFAASYGLIVWSVIANAYGVWYSWAYHAFAVVPRY
ncbi:MAG: hypothetical protein JO219_11550 [Candidatus Eremiobacteraeota bacterium]|nr:hypothetical protein [Candidatus Eremiobacteraeota bacterium]